MLFKNKSLITLFFITLLGFCLRFYKLDSFPPSLNWDEVSHGYNAYSLLLTGKDEWGFSWPLIFRSFGDYKLPLYIYLTILPIKLFGLNAFAIRFISALAGSLAIPFIYLLTKKLFIDQKLCIVNSQLSIGNIAAFMLAILPWHFFISRPALEANLALTLIIIAAWALVSNRLLLSSILFALSLHTYNSARIFVPLFLISYFLLSRLSSRAQSRAIALSLSKGSLKINFLSLSIFLISFGLVIYQMISGSGLARYQKLSLLSEATVFQIGQDRANSSLSPLISRLIHNRPVYVIEHVFLKYFSHFDLRFFNQSLGSHSQFAIPNQNILTWPILFFVLIGFLLSLKYYRQFPFKIIFLWLFLAPIADSLTIDPAHALRSSLMIPPLIIFASFGFVSLHKRVPWLLLVSFGLIIFSFVQYLKIYFTDYSVKYSSSWQYGYSQVYNYLSINQSEYDHVFITKRYGEPHIFYAFFNKLNPSFLQPNSNNIRFNKSNWLWTDKINNIYFINDWLIPQNQNANTLSLESGGQISTIHSLLITSPDHIPANANVLKQINFLDQTPAFIITSIP